MDPVTEEIGPYVYSATHVRRIIEVVNSSIVRIPIKENSFRSMRVVRI